MSFFSSIYDFISGIWNDLIVLVFSSNNIVFDIIDIIAVTFIVYKIIQFMRQTRAEQLIKGIVVFVIVYIFAQLLKLNAINWILSIIIANLIVVIVVLFQPEIRSILEKLGRNGISTFTFSRTEDENDSKERLIEIVCKAVDNMHKTKTGAIIIIEQKTMLNEIVNTGTLIDANASVNLIQNIFFKNSPLHDGAMIIRNERVYAASCILPLTQNPDLSSELGTRHRAAIGISETCDAAVIIVSEETGAISMASGGKIDRNVGVDVLKSELQNMMITVKEEDNEGRFKKIFKKKEDDKNEEK